MQLSVITGLKTSSLKILKLKKIKTKSRTETEPDSLSLAEISLKKINVPIRNPKFSQRKRKTVIRIESSNPNAFLRPNTIAEGNIRKRW